MSVVPAIYVQGIIQLIRVVVNNDHVPSKLDIGIQVM